MSLTLAATAVTACAAASPPAARATPSGPAADDSYARARPHGVTMDFEAGRSNEEISTACIGCHRKETPGEVDRYHGSLHAQAKPAIQCVTCHGRVGHGEYLAFGYRFASETLGADGKTLVGSGREHTYYEWQPTMVVRATRSCEQAGCHGRNYREAVGVDRVTASPNALTPFHGMLRFDHGISSWNDTMMSSFGLALWETYGIESFRENCVRCHSQVVAWNVAGPDPGHMSENEPLLRELMAAQARDVPSFAGNHFPGVKRESLLLSRCVECHVRHEFSRTSPRNASACGKCHSGPDHPQIEAYELSKHKLVADQRGVFSPTNQGGGPSCSTCHLSIEPQEKGTSAGPAVSHDLTRGLAWNYKRDSPEWRRERDTMLERCGSCHSQEFASIQLVSADVVARTVTGRLMKEVQGLCDEAYRDGLISPASNPFFDKPTEFLPTFFHAMPWRTGNYRVSAIEAACWNAWRERSVLSLETGAWHFSPQFSQWLGIKPADEFIGQLRDLIHAGRAR